MGSQVDQQTKQESKKLQKKWKKITFEQNMKDLDEWKSYQPKLTKINLETPSSPKIWKQILSLPVHPTVKNFVFKRCRRMIRTVESCKHCHEFGYRHIIHGDCPMNQGNKYSMEDFLTSFKNHKHNQGSKRSGLTPAEVANAWYANWFTYQAENNWLDDEHSPRTQVTVESSNRIRAKVLETLNQITGQLIPPPKGIL